MKQQSSGKQRSEGVRWTGWGWHRKVPEPGQSWFGARMHTLGCSALAILALLFPQTPMNSFGFWETRWESQTLGQVLQEEPPALTVLHSPAWCCLTSVTGPLHPAPVFINMEELSQAGQNTIISFSCPFRIVVV